MVCKYEETHFFECAVETPFLDMGSVKGLEKWQKKDGRRPSGPQPSPLPWSTPCRWEQRG